MHVVEVSGRRPALEQFVCKVTQQCGSDTARGAEAATLLGKKVCEALHHVDRVSSPVEDHE